MFGWSSLTSGWMLGFGLNVLAVTTVMLTYKGQLVSPSFRALYREMWLHRMLKCGSTSLWDRHSEGCSDILRSSASGFRFVSSSWWAHWTQPAGTESNECLIIELAGAEAEAAQTVHAERISLERIPGIKSIKVDSRVGKGRPQVHPSSVCSEHGHGKKCSPVERSCSLLLGHVCWPQCRHCSANSR